MKILSLLRRFFIRRIAAPIGVQQPQFKRLYSETAPQKVVGVQILNPKPYQRFSVDLVIKGISQGWIRAGSGEIVIRGDNGTLYYKIKESPGYYCCFCGIELESGPAALLHLSAAHKDWSSPDLNNPAGYRRSNHFDCILEG